MAGQKIYILDTNVLIEDPNSINTFDKAEIGIPVMILEELDHLKTESSFRGRNAREAIRMFDALRMRGSLVDGIALENGSTIKVLTPERAAETFFEPMSEQEVDNQILELAAQLQKRYDVELVSKDINLRVKADVIGLKSRDYRAELIDEKSIYRGWTTLDVSSIQLKKDMPDELLDAHKQRPYTVNEFIILQSASNPYNIRLFRYMGGNDFKSVEDIDLKWALHARNIQQRMAFDLLFDPHVQLVNLIGPAGTGKTFLALVAALHQVLLYEQYERVLVTRPVIPLGPDIGYLPGDVREKLHTWMQPIYDNMDFILHSARTQGQQRGHGIYREEEDEYRGKNKYKRRKQQRDAGMPSLDDLIEADKISLEAITYMRGRSIPYQFIIIDEVQNLSPHEVKTLISRVGEGSKLILTGDPYQIDAHHLDFSNNGLIVTNERFKGQPLFGSVYLETTERSELSRLAALLL